MAATEFKFEKLKSDFSVVCTKQLDDERLTINVKQIQTYPNIATFVWGDSFSWKDVGLSQKKLRDAVAKTSSDAILKLPNEKILFSLPNGVSFQLRGIEFICNSKSNSKSKSTSKSNVGASNRSKTNIFLLDLQPDVVSDALVFDDDSEFTPHAKINLHSDICELSGALLLHPGLSEMKSGKIGIHIFSLAPEVYPKMSCMFRCELCNEETNGSSWVSVFFRRNGEVFVKVDFSGVLYLDEIRYSI